MIRWSNPASVKYNDQGLDGNQLNASLRENIEGSFEYLPCEKTVLKPGRHELTTIFSPIDTSHYEKVQKSVFFTVDKILPEILWQPPIDATVVVGKEPPVSVRNAVCTDHIKYSVEYSHQFIINSSKGLNEVPSYDCVITVTIQPEPKFSKYFTAASKSIILPAFGSPLNSSEEIYSLYPKDRVYTLFPYGDKNFTF
jgi:hypothetical protein